MSLTREQALRTYQAGPDAVVEALLGLDGARVSASAALQQANRRIEELNAALYAARGEIQQAHGRIEELEKTCQAFERKLAALSKNSSNSGKPPSTDITKPKNKGDRNGNSGKKRKRGGQPGHRKNDRPLLDEQDINEFHDHIYARCPDCNGEVHLALGEEPRIIDQIEIKDVPIVLHRHISYPVWCPTCQKVHWKALPEHVVKEGLFKERLTALVAYMKHACHASFSTIRKFIRDVLKLKVSRGYLRKLIEKAGKAVDGPYEELRKRLPLERILNVDETGHPENGDDFYTWVFKAELYVFFRIDASRGSAVLIDTLGEEFDGVLGCDYFSAYRKYMKDFHVAVQFCLAHLIRDVRYLLSLPDADTRAYGERLLEALRGLFKTIHDREEMSENAFQAALEGAKETVMRAALDNVPSQLDRKGKELKREAQNVANRFRKHGEAYFTFITTPGMGPTNNLAEQAFRFVVIDRHITQGTRSARGRATSERLWTVIATCALQGRSAFEFILQAVHAYFHNEPAPSLLPDSG